MRERRQKALDREASKKTPRKGNRRQLAIWVLPHQMAEVRRVREEHPELGERSMSSALWALIREGIAALDRKESGGA